jgi:hypothetical protein
MITERSNEATCQSFFEAYNRHDVDAMMALCGEDCVAVYPDLARYTKSESVLSRKRDSLPSALSTHVDPGARVSRATDVRPTPHVATYRSATALTPVGARP